MVINMQTSSEELYEQKLMCCFYSVIGKVAWISMLSPPQMPFFSDANADFVEALELGSSRIILASGEASMSGWEWWHQLHGWKIPELNGGFLYGDYM